VRIKRKKPTTDALRKEVADLRYERDLKGTSNKRKAEIDARIEVITPPLPPKPKSEPVIQDSRITNGSSVANEPPPPAVPAPAAEAPLSERAKKFGCKTEPPPGILDLWEEDQRRCAAKAPETPASTWKTDSELAAMGKRTPITPAAPQALDLDRLPADHILWKVCRARVARLAKEDKIGKPAGFKSDYETQALRFVRESMEMLLYSKVYFPEQEQRDAILDARYLLDIDNPMPDAPPLPARNPPAMRKDALRFVPVPPFTNPIPGYLPPPVPASNPIDDAGRDLNARAKEFLAHDSWLQSLVRLDPMIDQTIIRSIVTEFLTRGHASGTFLTNLYNTLRERDKKFHHLPERGFGWR
jgi:hypothetical protein